MATGNSSQDTQEAEQGRCFFGRAPSDCWELTSMDLWLFCLQYSIERNAFC